MDVAIEDTPAGRTQYHSRERRTSQSVPLDPPPPYSRFADDHIEGDATGTVIPGSSSSAIAAFIDGFRGGASAFTTDDLEAGHMARALESSASNTLRPHVSSAVETAYIAGDELGSSMRLVMDRAWIAVDMAYQVCTDAVIRAIRSAVGRRAHNRVRRLLRR